MKLSYNWLKEFVPLDVTPQKLAEVITMKMAEVVSVIHRGREINKVYVGEILEIKPHPKATRLQLAKVSIGKDILEVVCGATNIRVGQKVPVAILGALLPGGVKIKAREIRGVKSEGMLTSAAELGLKANEPEGILILDPKTEVGRDVKEVLGLDDVIIDIETLPDRSYLLSHVGAARDISAMRSKVLMLDDYGRAGATQITNSQIVNDCSVKNMDQTLCPRYTTLLLSNLHIKRSPAWLSSRLENMGVRPVNNLVDLTNYVMFELGQPLHAFDLAKIGSRKIVVRRAKKGEKIITLDQEERELESEILVIADQKKPLAIAGIIGGKETEITHLTSGALIEAANFDTRVVRKGTQILKLKSEASMRFERGVDPNLTAVALARLVELLPRAGLVDAQPSQIVDDYPAPLIRQPVRYLPTEVRRLTGVDVPLTEQIRIMQGLGLVIDDRDYNTEKELLITPPSYRSDINHPADIVEEIIRIFGYEKVPLTLPTREMLPQPFENDRHWARKVKNILRGAGFTEVETYSFVSEQVLKRLNFDPDLHLRLKNPMSSEQAFLRSSLVPNALSVVKKNLAYGRGSMRFFELGRTFQYLKNKTYPYEPLMLCVVEVAQKPRSSTPRKEAPEWTHLMQIAESIIFNFGLDIEQIKPQAFVANPAFHSGRAALLQVGQDNIGFIAEIHPVVLESLGINRAVAVLDLRFAELIKIARGQRTFQPISPYPEVMRDLSLVVTKDTSAQKIIALIKQAGGPFVKDVVLFDRFEGRGIPKDKKSYAFHIIFQSTKRTLTDQEIAPALAKISQKLIAKKIEIRG